MDKLFELGISEVDLRNMLEIVPEIISMDDEEIISKIDILKYVGCSDKHIRNIIVSNPTYLDRIDSDVLKLISYLKQIGFSDLDLLIDSNPYFLNYDVFEIRNYINKKINDGMELEEIIDEIESNPYVIDWE